MLKDTPQSAPRRASLATIFLIVFIDLMGFGIVLPNLQLYGRDFGISNYFLLTLLGATYSIFQFLFAPVLGRWSDRVGRRPVLLISQVGTLVGFLLLYAAHFFEKSDAGIGIALLFISRIIDGISGGNISTASAYAADVTPPAQRAKGMGVIGAAFGIGFVFGPLIGGIVASRPYLGLPYVPLTAALFSATAIVLTYFTLPESLSAENRGQYTRRFSFGGMGRALRRPVIGSLILMFFVNGIAFAGMEQTLSLLIQNRLYNPAASAPRQLIKEADAQASFATGIFFFGLGIIVVLIQGGLIRLLAKRFGEVRLAIIGPLLIALGMFVIALPMPALLHATSEPAQRSAWWLGLAVGCAVLAVGSSLFTPAMQALISRHANSAEQGEILGANQGMASLARGIGPLLAGGLFQHFGAAAPYYAMAGLSLIVCLWGVAKRRALEPPG